MLSFCSNRTEAFFQRHKRAVNQRIKGQKTVTITFFSSTHGTFSRIDHILRHKTNLNKFKSIETISSIFSDHNGMKLEINQGKTKRDTQEHIYFCHYDQKPLLVLSWGNLAVF